MSIRSRLVLLAAACGLTLAVAAPALAQQPVTVYSSLPLQGASSDQTQAAVRGAKLAVKQAAGTLPAVAYIGEFNSGASALSIPILNGAGIAQVSPSNTYDGLTAASPGTDRGEPDRYFPTGVRTFFRIIPRDAVQARAIAAKMQRDGCQRIAIADDRDVYGAGIAKQVAIEARARGIKVVRRLRTKRERRYLTEARSVRSARAGCFFFGGVTFSGAPRLYDDVARLNRRVKLYGADGVCESGTTKRRVGGIRTSTARRFTCFVATLGLRSYPGGKAFLKAYRSAYGARNPDPYAIFGYESMQLVLDTLRALGPAATDRGQVVAALRATSGRASSIGTYGFDANGDTTLTRYGIYRPDRSGNPRYAGSITP